MSNLRSIVQVKLIYANDHNDQLPLGTDIWDDARLLAEADLNFASIWQSQLDPATTSRNELLEVLVPGEQRKNRQLNPAFRQIKPSYAIPLAKLNTKMTSSTPVIWTRGLQPDGSWSKHSPYGTESGFITFLGGNTSGYRNLSDDGGQLLRFDGKGKTANILEALPPGSKISEYTPTLSEQKKWTRINWQRTTVRKATNLWSISFLFIGIVYMPLFGSSKYGQKISTRALVITNVFLALLAVAISFV
jgi:hypothetical protein